jgi:hypothetical protein
MRTVASFASFATIRASCTATAAFTIVTAA